MQQLGLADGLQTLFKKPKVTRRQQFWAEMDRVVPWERLLALIAPVYPKGPGPRGGRPPHALATMLRLHFLQQWFGYSDPAMEEALHETPLLRQFARLSAGSQNLPDETALLHFRHLLERHALAPVLLDAVNGLLREQGLLLKTGTVMDATLIAAPPSTKNQDRARDPEMHQTQKGKQWYFGAQAHIGVDADSGLVHHVEVTAANVSDHQVIEPLLEGDEKLVLADGGYYRQDRVVGNETPSLNQGKTVIWTPHKRAGGGELSAHQRGANKALAQMRAKVEHAFRILKCQFGDRKVRYWGLAKNKAQIITLFMLGNLYQARHRLLASAG
jgi:IS5 family transposase